METAKNKIYGYKIFDLQLGEFKTGMQLFESEERAVDWYADCLHDQALDGNGGFEGTEEEIKAELKTWKNMELLKHFGYTVEEVTEDEMTLDDWYSILHEEIDSREKFITMLVDSFNDFDLPNSKRNAIEEYAINNQKWWNENK